MAHLLEKMAYVGDVPWHGLGNQLSANQPIEVWAQQAGMDWNIRESPVSFMTSDVSDSLDAIGSFPESRALGQAGALQRWVMIFWWIDTLETMRMLPAKSVSFRSHLQSNVADLIREVHWHCGRTSQLIAGIVSMLAAYTEEGVAMTPSVFICNSISELVQRAGMGEHMPLSDSIPTASAGAKILKAAAPLCRDNWRIYVERSANGETCRFGVFCGSSDPSSFTVDEVLLDDISTEFPVVRIAQSATNKVEVRTSAGNKIEFRFNDEEDVFELNSQAQIRSLACAIAAGVEAQPSVFTSFVERVLSAAIKSSHGCLIAVVAAESQSLPLSLQDAVPLATPVDLFERFRRHLDEGKTAVSVSRLQAAAELVAGFICSDGITVFNRSGLILGYRAFIRSQNDGAPVDGGARSRAYAAMCGIVGIDLNAAFFRSQDGRTEFAHDVSESIDE